MGQQTLWLSLVFRLQMIIDFENIHINMIKKRYLICEFSLSYWARASCFCCFQDLLCFYHLCYILWTYRLPSVPILIFVWLKIDLCHFFQITRPENGSKAHTNQRIAFAVTQVHTIYDTHPLIYSSYRVCRILITILIILIDFFDKKILNRSIPVYRPLDSVEPKLFNQPPFIGY